MELRVTPPASSLDSIAKIRARVCLCVRVRDGWTLAFGAAALGEVVQDVADGQRRRDAHAPLHEESSGESRLDNGRARPVSIHAHVFALDLIGAQLR